MTEEEKGIDFSYEMCDSLSHIFNTPSFFVNSVNLLKTSKDQYDYLRRFKKESIDRDMFDKFILGHRPYSGEYSISRHTLEMYGFNLKFVTNSMINSTNISELQKQINSNKQFKRDLTIITL